METMFRATKPDDVSAKDAEIARLQAAVKIQREPSLQVRMAGMKAWDKYMKARKGNVTWPEMMDVVFTTMYDEMLSEHAATIQEAQTKVGG